MSDSPFNFAPLGDQRDHHEHYTAGQRLNVEIGRLRQRESMLEAQIEVLERVLRDRSLVRMKEMTVADLIDRLKEAPPDAAVQINIDTDNGYVTSRPTMAWLVVRQNLVVIE